MKFFLFSAIFYKKAEVLFTKCRYLVSFLWNDINNSLIGRKLEDSEPLESS